MTEEIAKVVERIKKLLALANNNDNEHQAAAAMEKANELLAAYNLDMASVGGSDNKRNDKVRAGGLYGWQRKLWQSVAELNFCYYFSIKGLAKGSKYEHRLIGSHANVVATEMMAQYLQDRVEKLAQAWSKEVGHHSVFVREAIAYREGMTDRLSVRLANRRQEQLTQARKEAEERKRAQAHDTATAHTGNALTILDVVSSEADFNNDYLNGWEMGTTARHRAEEEARSAAYMAKWRAEEERQRLWDLAHPEEAAERKRKEAEKLAAYYKKYPTKAYKPKKEPVYRTRRATPEEERRSLGSYYDGYDKGATVGIDTQVAKQDRKAVR